MGRQTSDFVVDTVGHCFICMDEISPHLSLSVGASSSSIYSMLYLSWYLKIEMRKVLNEDVPIPKYLLDRVKMSTLKVGLCEECASWNSRLSELVRQLEKIEIEAASYLHLIHGKLQRSVHDGKTEIIFSKLTDRTSDSELMGKLEVAEILRKETMERCSEKLKRGAQLKVRIQKLSEKDIEILKQPKCNFETSIGVKSEGGLNDVKLETSNLQIEEMWDEYDNDYLDHFEDSAQGNISSVEHDSGSGVSEIRMTSKQNYVRNSQTGKYECKLCANTFASKAVFHRHFRSIHLKLRFNCKTCNKEFTQQGHLKIHEKSVHLKQRFDCQFCSLSFTTSGHRRCHIRLQRCKMMKNKSSTSKQQDYHPSRK